jgi:hypothetical protein
VHKTRRWDSPSAAILAQQTSHGRTSEQQDEGGQGDCVPARPLRVQAVIAAGRALPVASMTVMPSRAQHCRSTSAVSSEIWDWLSSSVPSMSMQISLQGTGANPTLPARWTGPCRTAACTSHPSAEVDMAAEHCLATGPTRNTDADGQSCCVQQYNANDEQMCTQVGCLNSLLTPKISRTKSPQKVYSDQEAKWSSFTTQIE